MRHDITASSPKRAMDQLRTFSHYLASAQFCRKKILLVNLKNMADQNIQRRSIANTNFLRVHVCIPNFETERVYDSMRCS